MKLCPFCAEEVQDAAIVCKHCHRDLGPAPCPSGRSPASAARSPARPRWLLLGLAAAGALVLAAPVLSRPLLRHLRTARCEPANIVEWHAAMRQRCLEPSYVCEHMTTPEMLEDPDVARSFSRGADAAALAEMVDRMRHAFGCAPESGPASRGVPPSMPAPWSPIPQDVLRAL